MPDSKITDLTSLITPANNDVLPIVDILNDTTKKIAVSSLAVFFNTTVNSNSANWNSTYTNVNSNSANWRPVGTGTELQFRNGTSFGAVGGSSISLAAGSLALVIGDTNSSTYSGVAVPAPNPGIVIRNSLSATSTVFQSTPALHLETQGWNSGTLASEARRMRAYFVGNSSPGGTSQFFIDTNTGTGSWFNQVNVTMRINNASNWNLNRGALTVANNTISLGDHGGTAQLASTVPLVWNSDATVGGINIDLFVRRRGLNNLCLGNTDSSSPSAQTFSVQSVATGTLSTAGALFTIDGSQSTGNALGGDIRFRTANASTTPTNSATINTLNEVFRIKANRTVNFSSLGADPTVGNAAGDVYYNSVFNALELFNGTAFVPLNTTRTIATFTPLQNQPVSANFATLNTRISDNLAVLQFSPGSPIKEARFVGVVPDNANLANGTLLVRTEFCTVTATTGVCRWGAQIKKLSTASYALSGGVNVNITGTANRSTMIGAITLPAIDSLAPGDAFDLRVFRESNNAADTMTGDFAQLLTVEVRTTN